MVSYRDWYAGMKVVCIRDDWKDVEGEVTPVLNGVYTIRAIEISDEDGEVYLLFAEIRNEPYEYEVGGFGECRFFAGKFRPVQERKTDIAIFTRMLTPKQEHEPV